MLLVLALAYFSQAIVQTAPLKSFARRLIADVASPDCICNSTRSLLDIIWSCLATIFACSWVSIHPNIPRPGETRVKKSLLRLELMFWSIVAPEMIIGWAMRQWWGARRLEAQYREHGWTRTHGHFLQMGGFTLYRGSDRQGVLFPEDLPRLLKERKINMPIISEADIQDRSKGDGLTKALVLVQTSWFVAQCIARKVEGLFVTQLELVTLALAVLNSVMYFLWWHKPLDVQSSVPVYLLEVANQDPTARPPTENPNSENVLEPNLPSSTQTPPSQPRQPWYIVLYHALMTVLGIVWRLLSGILFRWPVAVAWRLLLRMGNMLHSEHSNHVESRHAAKATPVLGVREKLHAAMIFSNAEAEQIPIFYAFKVDDTPTRNFLGVATFIATIFGAIHCAGWFFTFPTLTELTIWRVLSAFITAGPVIGTSIPPLFFLERYDKSSVRFCEQLGNVLSVVLILCVPLYIIARLGLLVEALIALRNLPQGAFDAIQWTTFLPHI